MAHSIVMPSTGMYTAEGKLLSWLRPNGAAVASGDAVAEIETEKSVFEIEAPQDGILHHISKVGATLLVEGLLGYILAEGEPVPAPVEPTRPESTKTGSVAGSTGDLRASPLAKRLAADYNLDLHQIVGAGPAGRIVENDVLAALSRRKSVPLTGAPSITVGRIRERRPISGPRRIIADRMRHSLATAASVTLTREIRANGLVAARACMRRTGCDVPYDAIFTKLLASALQEHSCFNSSIENDAIVIYEDIHIGFAVSLAGGLVVPVVRNADSQSLLSIAAAVRDLSSRARQGHLRPQDVTDATASITNLGLYGVDAFTPILNASQSVILGIGHIAQRPVVEDGQLKVGAAAVLSLTFDHRVADGAAAAQLLDFIAQRIADQRYLEDLAKG